MKAVLFICHLNEIKLSLYDLETGNELLLNTVTSFLVWEQIITMDKLCAL